MRFPATNDHSASFIKISPSKDSQNVFNTKKTTFFYLSENLIHRIDKRASDSILSDNGPTFPSHGYVLCPDPQLR